jgi:Tfp pilus assembly protein PilV
VSAVRQRRGFAVATALFALVVVGALAIGTLFASTHKLRSASDAVHQTRAIMAAELGVEQTLASWSRAWNGALGRGYGRTWTLATPEGAEVIVSLTRLADDLFLVSSEARAGPARRRVSRVVMLGIADPPLLAALAATMPVETGAGIDGSDRAPPGWDCPVPDGPLPQFIVADTSSLLRFGQFDWAALTEAASARVSLTILGAAPRFTGKECDTADHANWGEPVRSNGGACTGYYPVIHAPSDLVIDGGRGQGVLVVDGDLTLRGGFEFFGAVLVRGALLAGPGGARITGTVSIALQGPIAPVLDGITIDFSRCAARKALLGLATPLPLVERSWSEAFFEK